MALYEHVYLARQDVTAQQVEVTEQMKSVVAGLGGTISKVEYWGVKSLLRLPDQQEPQGAFHSDEHRRPLGRRRRDGAPDGHQRRHSSVHDPSRRGVEEGPSAMMRKREESDRDDRGPRGGRDRGDRGDRGPRRPREEAPAQQEAV